MPTSALSQLSESPVQEVGDYLLISTDVARRRLSCGKTKIFELIRAREIETVRLGTRRLVVASSLQSFVERLRHEQAEA